jgi:UDP-N-acetyl-2-amino-2-deoxyglucuronate dehydrogenase
MTRRRVALIGLGMAVGPHAQSLIDLNDRVEVAYAFSPTKERRQAFAERFTFPSADDLDTVLADESVDIVFILTPPNTHLDLVKRAVAAGKHVLLEKPLEVTTERAVELVEAARKADRRLAIMLQHRFRPAGMRLRELLAAGELGAVVGASAGMRLWRPQSYYDEPGRGTKARDGGGVLLTQGIHTLDLLISIAGEAEEVAAYATTTPVHRMETEDFAVAAVRYRNGALGTIEATTSAYPGFPERIEIITEKATATVLGTALSVQWQDGRSEEMGADATAGGTGADPMAFPPDYHRALIADFLDALDQSREPAVNGAEALKVHRLIDAIVESGGAAKPVQIPPSA